MRIKLVKPSRELKTMTTLVLKKLTTIETPELSKVFNIRESHPDSEN